MQAGDTVDVLLERTEDREGHIVLSREKAEKMKIWDEVEKAYADRKVVIGRVIERIKGGLAVDIGVRAFLPGSQIDVRPVRNLDALKGQELRMRVIKVNKKRGNIVLSRKALLEEENAEKKKTTLETLAEGKTLRGTVKNITDYGAFIDLGGIDGLLHITDMSWGRVGHPSELFKVNDEVDVIEQGAQSGAELGPQRLGLFCRRRLVDWLGGHPQARPGAHDTRAQPRSAGGTHDEGLRPARERPGGLQLRDRAHLGEPVARLGDEQDPATVVGSGLGGGPSLLGLGRDRHHHARQDHAIGKGQGGERVGVNCVGHAELHRGYLRLASDNSVAAPAIPA